MTNEATRPPGEDGIGWWRWAATYAIAERVRADAEAAARARPRKRRRRPKGVTRG